MLDERGVDYTYREVAEEPLALEELTALFARMDRSPRAALRLRDAETLGVDPDQSDAELLALMAEHPALLQRPILDDGRRAVTGRPVEALEDLLPPAS